ncbi:hypothetical protein [Streptomyces murinus]|uniref:hypothetical protein n=1 Tax=Streptomyces murinus TaxID=33900 RepID=UPI0036F11A7B
MPPHARPAAPPPGPRARRRPPLRKHTPRPLLAARRPPTADLREDCPLISPDPHAHREALAQLGLYLSEAKKILAEWDAYSDEHTDLDGWPYDDHAYGLRQSQRDADTAAAFQDLHDGARHLLATAEAQLPLIPPGIAQTRWVYQLGVLHGALKQLDTLNEQWLATRDDLPAAAKPGTTTFDTALAEHHAECWSYLDDWATHGHAITEINAAARSAPSPLAPSPPTAQPVPATARTSLARR